ncbi:SDR family NAD(P)-dependent oxidoreductase [Brevibacillus porteri]|nr:SDR family NAD(P)-dependent oxidoreductase [Brevibacillus porteri]MED1798841.1 SDR family NAD(P)-dependent oxidoreductase [Brevibacillus porteri]MED2131524.1 SDR family NAD(P)-dependent oxidoreductase [Brevibacillus porteri]MED2744077.1 SDR family NAD(P)-dependent oxidoreductase [Brevibacillus porteri]MED2813291.1 SDR family NAD(P)-dependent oxidoreductase [Brevibacillus porteri]MED2896609.1 SDR family NAD(P)-dependent oxidoreductase [Brevibacillus porteri]
MLSQDQWQSMSVQQKKRLLHKLEQNGAEYGVFPLSAEQKRMWFLDQANPNDPSYHICFTFSLKGIVDEERILRALRLVIERHEVLRTRIITLDGQPFQIPDLSAEQFHFRREAITEIEGIDAVQDVLKTERAMAFDLENDFPIRALLLDISEGHAQLVITIHHIAVDGWSIGLFVGEWIEAYKGRAQDNEQEGEILPGAPDLQYVDYAVWQKSQIGEGAWQDSLAYWKRQLKEAPVSIDLPYDTRNQEQKKSGGGAEFFLLVAEECEPLQELARSRRCSLFHVLLSAFYIALSRFTSQSALNVGTAAANRGNEPFKKTMGLFANTVLLHQSIHPDRTFSETLDDFKEKVLEAFEHQHIPFDRVIDALGAERRPGMDPYLQAMFLLQNSSLSPLGLETPAKLIGDTEVCVQLPGNEIVEHASLPMILTAVEQTGGIGFRLTYQKDKFSQERMQLFLQHFIGLLGEIGNNSGLKIKEYRLMSPSTEDAWKRRIGVRQDEGLIPVWSIAQGQTLRVHPSMCQRNGDRWVTILNTEGNDCPPGFPGHVYVSEQTLDEWLPSGDLGEWGADGSLHLRLSKHMELSYLDSAKQKPWTAASLEQAIRKLPDLQDSCVDRYITPTGTEAIVIYYVAAQAKPLGMFQQLLATPAGGVQGESEWLVCRVRHIPSNAWGWPDISWLRLQWSDAVEQALQQRKRLIDHPDTETVVVLPGEDRFAQLTIPIRELCLPHLKKEGTDALADSRHSPLRKLSLCEGPPLEELQVKTLPELLRQTAAYFPNHQLMTVGSNGRTAFSYAELLQLAERGALHLRASGVKKGERILLFVHELDQWIQIFWSCVLAGAIPVPIGVPKMADRNTGGGSAVDKLLAVRAFLGNPRIICDEREELQHYFHVRDITLHEQDILEPSAILNVPVARTEWSDNVAIEEADVAVILFTSGSTGMPKGVRLTHRNVLKRSQAVAKHNRFDSTEVSLNWMPLDHVGGLVMFHLLDVYTGACQIHAETEHILQDPLLWMDYANDYGVTVTWAPNFAFGLIAEQEQEVLRRSWDLSRLRFILNGGEKIQARTARRFMQLMKSKSLPQTAMHPSWGMTETSSGVTFSTSFSIGDTANPAEFVAVGCPVAGTSLRIVGDDGTPVEMGEEGQLEIYGETVTAGYEANEEENRSSFSKDGWFITGDLARIIDNELVITGRIKEVIIINGLKYGSADIENTAEESGYVLAGCAAACSVQNPGENTDRVLLFCTFIDGQDQEAAASFVRHRVLQKTGVFVDELIPIHAEEFPRTSIGKINRSVLRDRYRGGVYTGRGFGRAIGIPSWFYEKQWERREWINPGDGGENRTRVIFAEKDGAGESIAQILRSQGMTTYEVQPGTSFEQHGSRFFLNVQDPGHVQRLHRSIREAGERTDIIMYCQNDLASCDRPYTVLLPLLHLLQEFGGDNDNAPLRLTVVSQGAVRVQEKDIISPTLGSLTGFLRTVSVEMPHVMVKHVDMDNEVSDWRTWAGLLTAETAEHAYSPQVAYREGKRYVPVLKEVSMTQEDIDAKRGFRQGGVYVLTGGLGAIGRIVAAHILSIYKARVMLIGRTDLHTAGGERGSELRAAMDSLSALGEVVYERADVTSMEDLSRAFDSVRARWGHLDGILHLAGEGHHFNWKEMDNTLIRNMSEAALQEAFWAKVQGGRNVLDWAQTQENIEVIMFSSVNSLLGGSGLAAYSAASSCLDSEVLSRIHQVTCKSIQWSFWDTNSTMLNGGQNAGASRQMMSRWQALVSLEAVMQRNNCSMIVGLHGTADELCKQYGVISQKGAPAFTLVYSSQTREPIEGVVSNSLIGSLVRTEFVPHIPFDHMGSVDEQRLVTLLKGRGRTADGPVNETERALMEIWGQTLQHWQFQLDDKFFEVGGNSLHTVRVISRINEQFHTSLSVTDLFQYPTIRQLSAYLEKHTKGNDDDQSKAEELTGITF